MLYKYITLKLEDAPSQIISRPTSDESCLWETSLWFRPLVAQVTQRWLLKSQSWEPRSQPSAVIPQFCLG